MNLKAKLGFLAIAILTFVSAHAAAEVRPLYSKRTITVGSKKVEVEVADTSEKRSYGLMFVEKLASDSGMLFIFDTEEPLSFWMKNTLIPLSIAYINEKKRIIDIQEMVPEKSLLVQNPKTYPSKGPARYALEMNKGWFKKNGIKVGTQLVF
jgi:uncharacterized membrane protein (UPF0127 family)